MREGQKFAHIYETYICIDKEAAWVIGEHIKRAICVVNGAPEVLCTPLKMASCRTHKLFAHPFVSSTMPYSVLAVCIRKLVDQLLGAIARTLTH